MGETITRCSGCCGTKNVQWCDHCGVRLRTGVIEIAYGFGHYRDGSTHHFCCIDCQRAWEGDEEQQRKQPQRPKEWRWPEQDNGGVDLVCDRCEYRVNTRDFVRLKVEDYAQPYGSGDASGRGLIDAEACPRCGWRLEAAWVEREP